MQKKMNVESFNLDHTTVEAPYLRLADKKTGEHGDCIYKYDLRICQPNVDHMEMPALHSLLNDESYQSALNLVEKTLQDVLKATEVPACNPIQCGWAASHSLIGAQELARKLLAKRSEWENVFKKN